MKLTIDTTSQFAEAFKAAGRENQFSYEALIALFEHLEENDPDYELDVVGLCCEWSEYETAQEAAEDYGFSNPQPVETDFDSKEEFEDAITEWENEAEDKVNDWLSDKTTVVPFSGGVLIVQF